MYTGSFSSPCWFDFYVCESRILSVSFGIGRAAIGDVLVFTIARVQFVEWIQ